MRRTTETSSSGNMREGLYTIVCEYRGGTYIKQLVACNAQSAFLLWVDGALAEEQPFDKSAKGLLRTKLDSSAIEIIDLKGLQNAWCGDFTLNRQYVSVTLVLTSPRDIPAGADL